MRTHASFRGDFPEDHAVKPESHEPPGGPIADLMADHLGRVGIRISNRDSTDYSHCFFADSNGRQFYVTVGLVGDGDRQWLVMADATVLFFLRWLGRRDDQQHQQLLTTIHQCLAGDSRISALRWYTPDEWNSALEGGTAHPLDRPLGH